MTNTNDIPAFPSHLKWHDGQLGLNKELVSEGMTLRDYFAIETLNGMLQNSDFLITNENETVGEKLIRSAYEMADAMLKAREVKS